MLDVIAVFDKKTGAFDGPFTVKHKALATREWEMVRKDPKTKYGMHPEDYSLMKIAEFDEQLGHFIPHPHETLQSGV